MKHHLYNQNFQFVNKPVEFNKYTDRSFLQYCLGATLYMPGIKDIKQKVLEKKLDDVTSIVMCLEDAIREEDLPVAEKNILEHLDFFANHIENGMLSIDDIPLIFIRVRNVDQFESFAKRITPKHISSLSGFAFPKFNSLNAQKYLSILNETSTAMNGLLYGMPILEGEEIAYKEFRERELLLLRNILIPYKHLILNIRIGGTDISSLFGLRRNINSSVYDLLTVRDALSDILNFFSRNIEYIVSGAVWEYFLAYKQDDINDLLKQDLHHSLVTRVPIINESIDGLLRETLLDKANGFVGKTIIHPSHARFVNAMHVVTEEEYSDAMQVLNTSGGVIKSNSGNKMNEVNPHRNWANKIVNRAAIYGVVKTEEEILKLIIKNK
jgi:citrate lyase beta subunit